MTKNSSNQKNKILNNQKQIQKVTKLIPINSFIDVKTTKSNNTD